MQKNKCGPSVAAGVGQGELSNQMVEHHVGVIDRIKLGEAGIMYLVKNLVLGFWCQGGCRAWVVCTVTA